MKEQVFKSLASVTSTPASGQANGEVIAYDGARSEFAIYATQDVSQNATSMTVRLQLSADGTNWSQTFSLDLTFPSGAVRTDVETPSATVSSPYPAAFARLIVLANGAQTFNPITGYIVAV